MIITRIIPIHLILITIVTWYIHGTEYYRYTIMYIISLNNYITNY